MSSFGISGDLVAIGALSMLIIMLGTVLFSKIEAQK